MNVRVLHGDMREMLATLDADSIEACVTDPPYELAFMGRVWDQTGVAFQPDAWRAVWRVLKPGGHMLCFGGSRTFARMFCAIEDAGFEYRDTLMWLYGTGFPKSRNVGGGWGTALKPAFEPIILARKPLEGTVAANVLAHGTGALNIDACRIDSGGTHGSANSAGLGAGRSTANHDGPAFGKGLGGVVAPPHTAGRWPANVLHDGSDEVEAAFAAFGERKAAASNSTGQSGDVMRLGIRPTETAPGYADSGTASRFFYSAKADASDRADSKHPTVKPVALMRWLVRLVTPPGGMVLDPFAGSGTTGEAAMLEGFGALLIEQDAQHVADIRHRIARWSGEGVGLFAATEMEPAG